MNFTTAAGLALLVTGLALTVTPLPGGFLLLALALRILARSSSTAARIIARARRQHRVLDAIIGRAIGAAPAAQI